MRIVRGVVGFGLVVGSLAGFAACSDTPVAVDDPDAADPVVVDSAAPPKDAAKPPVDARVPDTSTPRRT